MPAFRTRPARSPLPVNPAPAPLRRPSRLAARALAFTLAAVLPVTIASASPPLPAEVAPGAPLAAGLPAGGIDPNAGVLPPDLDATETRGTVDGTRFQLHRKWGVNGLRDDNFASTSNGNYHAHGTARLASGEVVVVGSIRRGATGTATELGIVKYNGRGQRTAWSAATAEFALFSNQYLRFPGSGGWQGRSISTVHDVHVRGTDIYVLVTQVTADNRFIPAVIRFRDDGGFGGFWEMAPDGDWNRAAVAMDVEGNQMVVLGRRSSNNLTQDGGYWTARITIESSGLLSLGAVTTLQTGQPRLPVDIAFRRDYPIGVGPISRPYYVAYTFHDSTAVNTARRPCVARINGSNQLDTGFGESGVRCFPFTDGGNDRDVAVALHTRRFGTVFDDDEALYLVVDVQRTRANGTGVVNLTNGIPDASFGPGGKRLYGGCAGYAAGDGEGCSTTVGSARGHRPLAVHSSAAGVFVAGYREALSSSNPTLVRPMMIDIDGGNGALRSIGVFGNLPGSRFTDLVPRGTDGLQYTLVGWSSATEGAASNRSFLSGHVIRSSELIFYDGLQP